MNSNQAVRDYWNINVSNWKVASDLDVGSQAFFQEIERYRFDKLDYLPQVIDYDGYNGKSVLDVGCGLGTDLSRFAGGEADVTGIDIAPRALELARRNFELRDLQGNFELMDGESMSFADNSFDFAYCHTVLHFTGRPQLMINEIHRVLRPGGTALLMTINRGSWLYILHKIAGLKIDYLDAPVFHRFNYAEFESMLAPFNESHILVKRFPKRTEVHKGWKAHVYNSFFVSPYNALPKAVIGKTGYHLLAFVKK